MDIVNILVEGRGDAAHKPPVGTKHFWKPCIAYLEVVVALLIVIFFLGRTYTYTC